jgi:hypothetical protein
MTRMKGARGLLGGVGVACVVAAFVIARAHGANPSAAVNPVGVWRVVDYIATDPVTGAVKHPFGESPIGSAIYTVNGHMSILVAGSHRVPSATIAGPKRAQERADLLDGMYAYTGTYTVQGDQVSIHIESAWIPDWVGTDKTRTLKLDHDLLSIVTAPMKSPVDGQTYVSTTMFKRVE